MSLNDLNLGVAQGADVHPGVANPTTASVNPDPYRANDVGDVSQAPDSAAKRLKETSTSNAMQSGILASTHIDPLKEDKAPAPGITEKVNATYQTVKETIIGK